MSSRGAEEKTQSERKPAEDALELRRLWREVLLRLISLYFVPLVLLAIFFNLQYRGMIRESEWVHLRSLAEQQAATLDMFLNERLVNLSNVIDDPSFPEQPSRELMDNVLESLQQTSPAFVEIATLGPEGRILSYAGPHPSLESRSYSEEPWFVTLSEGQETYVITDIYSGFREQPHFTVAIKRPSEERYRVLRAVLAPDRIYEQMAASGQDSNLQNALVNEEGTYQVVNPDMAQPLSGSPFHPPRSPRAGTANTEHDGNDVQFGYAWLNTSPWALVVFAGEDGLEGRAYATLYRNLIIFTLIFFVFGGVVIWIHARTSVRVLWRARETEKVLSGQLIQAAKLASVGELAAGIAHEINNPLAIIAEEVGLLKDLMDPEFGGDLAQEDLAEHLDTMHEAVFRGRDITRKLLGFVRKTEVRLEEHDIHDVIDEVADGLLGREFELSGVKILRKYNARPSKLVTDRNQLEQVLLNLMKNAVDAMGGKGTLTVQTTAAENLLNIAVADTGCGMNREQMERVFQPFFTTKDPGKGTGLGLSVSQGIVESLGGSMYVDSVLCEGSTFSVELPVDHWSEGSKTKSAAQERSR